MFPSATKVSLTSGNVQGLPCRPAKVVSIEGRRSVAIVAQVRRVSNGALDPEAKQLIDMDRRRGSSRSAVASEASSGASGNAALDPAADFMTKVKAAWRIFFPDKPRPLSPKEEGKKRLRMILVADRCGMTSDSLVVMRESIVRAMSDFIEVEADEEVQVNLSMDPEIGTIYSVNVPVKRVKPGLRPGMSEEVATGPGMWDPTDVNSDPSDQFPYGT